MSPVFFVDCLVIRRGKCYCVVGLRLLGGVYFLRKVNQAFVTVIAVMIAMIVQEFDSIAFVGDTSSMRRLIRNYSYCI